MLKGIEEFKHDIEASKRQLAVKLFKNEKELKKKDNDLSLMLWIFQPKMKACPRDMLGFEGKIDGIAIEAKVLIV